MIPGCGGRRWPLRAHIHTLAAHTCLATASILLIPLLNPPVALLALHVHNPFVPGCIAIFDSAVQRRVGYRCLRMMRAVVTAAAKRLRVRMLARAGDAAAVTIRKVADALHAMEVAEGAATSERLRFPVRLGAAVGAGSSAPCGALAPHRIGGVGPVLGAQLLAPTQRRGDGMGVV